MKTFTRIELKGTEDLMVFPKNKNCVAARAILDEYKENVALDNMNAESIKSSVDLVVGTFKTKIEAEQKAYSELTEADERTKYTYRINKVKKHLADFMEELNGFGGIVVNALIEVKGGITEKEFPLELNLNEEQQVAMNTYLTARELVDIEITDDMIKEVKALINVDEYNEFVFSKCQITKLFKDNKYNVEETSGVVQLLTV